MGELLLYVTVVLVAMGPNMALGSVMKASGEGLRIVGKTVTTAVRGVSTGVLERMGDQASSLH